MKGSRCLMPGVAALLWVACSTDGGQPPSGDGTGLHLEFGTPLEFGTRPDASPDLSFDTGPLPDIDIGPLPTPSCEFLSPSDGETIADEQTYVLVQTRHALKGTVVALLVDFVPQRTAVIDDLGKAEFVAVPLPPPSEKRVELRAEVRLYPMHKISCWIFIKVAAKP